MKKKLGVTLVPMLLMASPAFAQEVTNSDVMTYGNALVSKQVEQMKQNGPDWLKHADLSITFDEKMKAQYSLETVIPFHQSMDKVQTTFTQFNISNGNYEGTVANLGLGYRKLLDNKTKMFGVNTFFDYGFRYKHERVGLGTEYFFGVAEARANVYHGISGERVVGNDNGSPIFEKVVDGFDYEVGMPLPHMPYMKVFVQGFQWDYKYQNDEVGYRVRSEIQVTPRFNLEVGYVDSNHTKDKYAKVMYDLVSKKTPAMFGEGQPIVRPERWEAKNLESKTLDKVKRENDIKVERYEKVVTNGGTITISIGG